MPARPSSRPGARTAIPVLTVVLALLLVGAASAVADPPPAGPPPDQPLPGYTIVAPQLEPLEVPGGRTTVLSGVDEHAGYLIEVPPHWNGRLVMWAHGFRGG